MAEKKNRYRWIIRQRKKLTVVATLLFFLYFICYGLIIFHITDLEKLFLHKSALEQIYFVVQIIVGVSVTLGAVIGIWQYVLTARCERVKIANDRVEKAINLAEYYKDNILTKVTMLKFVFEKSRIIVELSKINKSQMKNFDSNELAMLLSPLDIGSIKEKMYTDEMAKCIVEADEVFGYELGINNHLYIIKDKNGETVNKEELLSKFMSHAINSLLNNMELFAMYFTHKVADESVVFQSLHQTYLEAVQLLYYDISKNNKPDGMQFYTNIVELYKIWYQKCEENRRRVEEAGRRVGQISKGASVENLDS